MQLLDGASARRVLAIESVDDRLFREHLNHLIPELGCVEEILDFDPLGTFTPSPARRRIVVSTSAVDSPGRIRQLITAEQPVGHRLRRVRRSALNLHGLDLDQLLQDVSGKGPVGRRESGLGNRLRRQRDDKKERRKKAAHRVAHNPSFTKRTLGDLFTLATCQTCAVFSQLDD
jgi:hypothetical protein